MLFMNLNINPEISDSLQRAEPWLQPYQFWLILLLIVLMAIWAFRSRR